MTANLPLLPRPSKAADGPSAWQRAWIYQQERFPLAAHAPIIFAFSASAVCFSRLLRGDLGWPNWAAAGVAFGSALIFFLQLRIADEFKDFKEDSRFRPYRPVPRGLVTLKELAAVGWAGGAVQLLLALALVPPLFSHGGQPGGWLTVTGLVGLLALVWLWLGLMSREFFVGSWLRARPLLYLGTHILIVPLVDFYATACDWLSAGLTRPPAGLGWFLAVSFGNALVLEIGRKIRAPVDEEIGVETYTVLWGRQSAPLAWFGCVVATGIAAMHAARAIDFALPVGVGMGVLFLAAGLASRRFRHASTHDNAHRFEVFSGTFVCTTYFLLGLLPMTAHSLFS